MNACMGSDLSGEMATSQAFLVFKSSYDLNASVLVVVVPSEDLPPGNLPYIEIPLSVWNRPLVVRPESFHRTPPLGLRLNPGSRELYDRPKNDEEWRTVGEIRTTYLLWDRLFESGLVERSYHAGTRHVSVHGHIFRYSRKRQFGLTRQRLSVFFTWQLIGRCTEA